jgi:hypothetical protein
MTRSAISHVFCLLLCVSTVSAGCDAQRKPAPETNPGASRARPSNGSFNPTVPHVVSDPQFGVPFGTIYAPQGWGFNGGVIHAETCAVTGPSPVFAIESPDHLYGVIHLPYLQSHWSSSLQGAAQLRQAGCMPSRSMTAVDFIRNQVIPRLGLKDAQIREVAPNPSLQQAVEQQRTMVERINSGMPHTAFQRQQTNIEGNNVVVSFNANGHDMAMVVAALVSCTDQVMTIPVTNARIENNQCHAYALEAQYAPKDRAVETLKNGLYKLQVNPDWDRRSSQFLAAQGQAIALSGQQQLAITQQRNQADLQNRFDSWKQSSAAQRQQYDQQLGAMRNQSDATQEQHEAFAAHMGDYNDYTDPNTGQTVRLSNQYSNTYVNSQGTVALQTNQAGSPGVTWSYMVPRF